ncbi:MAG: sigma-54-dependent Fis family transcriptional regulator [Deltaproteobacteria bacterium]|nr:sigma-54-dependent Fis family transcriptional regulator [Deltaproteobacteria bacterium]
MTRTLLIVDDDVDLCRLVKDGLGHEGFDVHVANSPAEALASIGEHEFDAVLADINMPQMNGLELSRRILDMRPDLPILVITAFGSLETAIAAIRAGAYDFVTKPFEIDQLAVAAERACQNRQLREEVRRLREVVTAQPAFSDILGESSEIRRMCNLIDVTAQTDSTVLVTGESGTGKELVARALHDRGPRSSGPFVALNCAAMTDSLLESELFGHARGAFTDAKDSRVGLFVKAGSGTLFLDEIGDMPPGMQAKLLRALEARTVRPVGSDSEVPFRARIIAATNHDLEAAVEEGRFRQDLYFRVNVIRIHVPPLRARGGDTLLLAQSFAGKLAKRLGKNVTGISSPAAERLLAYPWPGNIRELQNAIERAVALTRYENIVVEDLPESIRDYKRAPLLPSGDDPAEFLPMHEIEKRYILRVLEAVGGNKTTAAQILGFDRRTMYRKLDRFAEDKSG